jgi:opacity protein-like surface antigen
VGYARGAVVVDDIESILGRATIRVGTNLTAGGVAWQPFVTASVFHEFAGDVTATSVALLNGTGFDLFALQMKSTGGVGTYGQFAVGTAFQVLSTGWLGYGRVDYRSGENIEGVSVNAGLRYQFAPDQPGAGLKDAPLARGGRPYNWAGLYAGGFSGITWGKEEWFSPASGLGVDPKFAGYLIGGQAGYNIQSGRWVYGVEADLGASNAKGGRACPNAFFFTCEAELGWLGSLTGRVGFTWERALFYAKGGLAIGEVTASGFANQGPAAILPVVVTSGTDTQTGWTIGGGMEFALTDKWSAKAEYMYYDLGSATHVLDNTETGKVEVDTHGSAVRIGVNYHFGR